ncbi:MAG: DUF4149 domain-containing protein [Polyangiaceae bacterium]
MTATDVRERVLGALSGLAVAVWLGGLVVLGAVVAPTVFHNVPAPHAADAMTLVFRRFDRIALAAAGVSIVAEAFRARRGPTIVLLLVAAALAAVEAIHFSPAIEALHRGGAIRGLGVAGAELDAIHRWAERLAKAEVLTLVAFVVARVNSVARGPSNGVGTRVPPVA